MLGMGARHKHGLIGLALFGLTLAVYVSGLPSGITWSNTASDSGELVAVVRNLGVAHPPGYPTYALLGKVFTTLVPFGEPAFRLNLMSAAAAAGAVTAIFFAGLCLMGLVVAEASARAQHAPPLPGARGEPGVLDERSPLTSALPALVGAMALAFAPVFWSQAIVTEVYALNALFVALVALLALSWLQAVRRGEQPSMSRPVAAALLTGLGLGNHLTLAAFAVPMLMLVAWRAPTRPAATRAAMLAGLVLGLGVYVYVPVAASADPAIVWSDPTTWSGFTWLVTGNIYQDFIFGVPLEQWGDRIEAWLELMLEQFYGVGMLLGVIGAWRVWARDTALGAGLTLAFLFIAAYAIFYDTADSFVFLIPSLLVAGLWIGSGTHWLVAEMLLPRLAAAGGRLAACRVALAATGTLVLLIPGLVVLINYPTAGDLELDLSGDREAAAFGKEVFDIVEADAIVLAGLGDRPVFSLWHERYVVQRDSHVSVVARDLLQFDWYVELLRRRYPGLIPASLPDEFSGTVRAIVDEHLGSRPVYLTYTDAVLAERYEMEVQGPLLRVVRKLNG